MNSPFLHSPVMAVLLCSLLIQNFLADNIRAASRHSNRKDPKQQQLKELQEKRERELVQHHRGQLPQ